MHSTGHEHDTVRDGVAPLDPAEKTAHADGAHTHDRHAGHSPEMFRSRFWLSAALTIPILYFSEPLQHWFGYEAARFPGSQWVDPILASIVYLYGGTPFLVGAVRELRMRVPGMMTLVAMAITVAYVYSLAVTFTGVGMPFYWELATLIVVMLLGHWFELLAVRGASQALAHLASLLPEMAHRLEHGDVVDVPVHALRDGDHVLVRPGEQVPADGRIVEGATSVNEAFLTGESRPVSKRAGDEMIAGSVNAEGAVTIEITRTGARTTLSQILRLVQEAERSRSRYQAVGDRAAMVLTIVALAVGAATLIAWLSIDGMWSMAIERAVTVMVIACPHALGLAIPLVVVNATGLAARHGILVRNREAFERAHDLRAVAFDKTGTLTEGRFEVRRISGALPEDEALALGAALERASEHPLAVAIVEAAEARGLTAVPATDVRAVPGQGLVGVVDGTAYRIGRPEWAHELGVSRSPAIEAALAEADARGESAIVLMDDAAARAVFSLADRVRETARAAVGALQRLGVEVVMITGDAEAVAKTVAGELDIRRYHARVLPHEKAAFVRRLRADIGPVAFVGDGINDAPALREADLGIAIGTGTNVAIESADLVLVENDPTDVVRGLRLSRRTFAKMTQNLWWATGYNVVAIPLAAGVAAAWGILLTPAAGAVLMSASTVIVALNALLLRRARLD